MKKLKKPYQRIFRREFSEKQMLDYFKKDNRKKKRLFRTALSITFSSLILATAWLLGAMFANDPIFIRFFYVYAVLWSIGGISALVALTVWIILKFSTSVPTDKEYDAWVERKAKELLRVALRKVNLDHLSEDEIEEMPFIHGFVLKGTSNAKNYRTQDILWKEGKDHNQRYSINVYRYFYPIENQLTVFVIDINAINHRDRREQIHEYFFADVVAVTTVDEHDLITDEHGDHEYLTQSFTLRISDGKPITVTIRSLPLDHEEELHTYKLPNSSTVDDTIRRLRFLLRSNKQGTQYSVGAPLLLDDELEDENEEIDEDEE